jgi:hypothetical protein
MGLNHAGTLSLGACVPGANAAIVAALPDMQARLTGLLAAQAQLTITPPAFTATLAAAVQLVAGLTASGVLPSVGLQLTLIGDLIAALQVSVDALVALQVALGSAGIDAWTYSGRADGLGPALAAATVSGLPAGGGPGASAYGVVLATTAPAAQASMQIILVT